MFRDASATNKLVREFVVMTITRGNSSTLIFDRQQAHTTGTFSHTISRTFSVGAAPAQSRGYATLSAADGSANNKAPDVVALSSSAIAGAKRRCGRDAANLAAVLLSLCIRLIQTK